LRSLAETPLREMPQREVPIWICGEY